MNFIVLLYIFFGAAVSCGILYKVIPLLSLRFQDKPNARSSHKHPTPRGGGVIFVLLTLFSCALDLFISSGSTSLSLPLLSGSLVLIPLALVGFLDDLYCIPPSLRYFIQLVTAFLIIIVTPLPVFSLSSLPLLILLLIAITGVINFTNFMDGLDGLVAGCMAIAITSASIQLSAPWPIWILVGSLVGFLPFNWTPAKVFMGDVGSTFLGAFFTMIILNASTWTDAFALLLVASPLLVDAFSCLLRRLVAGHRVFQAHRLHLFQRLHQAGWSHPRVSVLYITATALLSLILFFGSLPWIIVFVSIEISIGIWLDQNVAVRFAVASRT